MYGQVLHYVVTDFNSAYAISSDVIPQVVVNTGGLIPVKMCDSLAVLPTFQLLAKCVLLT